MMKKTDVNQTKEITDFKFYQQTQFMNIQNNLNKDFAELREKITFNITTYNERTKEDLFNFQNKLQNDLYAFQNKLYDNMIKLFDNLAKNVQDNIDKINERVDLRLNEGFAKTTQTFNNILERISKIDEAQKKIESLSNNIISLQDVLTDKKARGTFGEIQLKQILVSVFGENNPKIYELQKKLSNDRVVDAILHAPEPIGSICIDSKFPLENYRRMIDRNLPKEETDLAFRKFKADVKKHIDDIREKYIISNETADSAIMFIPAEAVFAEINANHEDLIMYAQNAKVWIASPTTLMFLLTTVQLILQNIERDKYSAIIHEELNRLGVEFKRYKERWDKLARNIDQVSEGVKSLHTTSTKIEKRFESIARVDLDKNKLNYYEENDDYFEEDENEKSST
ncbi:MAG: DNA recombination protein RmuC [Bacilli bacterium]|nr:DNA recombination protein RmuC [Bacilli bacterium]